MAPTVRTLSGRVGGGDGGGGDGGGEKGVFMSCSYHLDTPAHPLV